MSATDAGADSAVLVSGLRKRYRALDRPALDGISLAVRAGEFYGILGPNGAGKTTLISILCGLRAADSGDVRLLGRDARRGPGRLRGRIGLVPQDIALHETLTVAENCRLFGRLYGLDRRRLADRVAANLALVGLESRAGDRVASLSGGMKRLLNLVVALLHEPTLLILDEPTVGVDVATRHRIHGLLGALRRQGTTLLFSTHYLEEAERLCTRVAILHRGRVRAEGAPGELLAAGRAANLEDVFVALTED